MGDDDPSTEELLIAQRKREAVESELAEEADLPEEELAHERRAEKAGYLAEKLKEQQASSD